MEVGKAQDADTASPDIVILRDAKGQVAVHVLLVEFAFPRHHGGVEHGELVKQLAHDLLVLERLMSQVYRATVHQTRSRPHLINSINCLGSVDAQAAG